MRVRGSWLLMLPLLSCSVPAGCASTPAGGASDDANALASSSDDEHASTNDAPARSSQDHLSCTADDDCVLSCDYGAVSTAWRDEMLPGGTSCQDGCASQGVSTKCVRGRCAAFRDIGQGRHPLPFCTDTAEARQLKRPAVPGLAHQCETDEDCSLRCREGAVNPEHMSWLVAEVGDCEGGCTEGTKVRCKDGMCAAYRGKRVAEDCTGQSIWPQ